MVGIKALASCPVNLVKSAYAKSENTVGHSSKYASYAASMRNTAVNTAMTGNFFTSRVVTLIQGLASALFGLGEGLFHTTRCLTTSTLFHVVKLEPKNAMWKLVEGVITAVATLLNTVGMTGLSVLSLIAPKTAMGLANKAPVVTVASAAATTTTVTEKKETTVRTAVVEEPVAPVDDQVAEAGASVPKEAVPVTEAGASVPAEEVPVTEAGASVPAEEVPVAEAGASVPEEAVPVVVIGEEEEAPLTSAVVPEAPAADAGATTTTTAAPVVHHRTPTRDAAVRANSRIHQQVASGAV